MDDVLKRRATSFGQVADEYARGRPGYPAEAIDWVLESAPGGRVIDLGAGTGKLTRALVAPGRTVTAIEPLDEMRERLAADLPEVTTLAGSAESMPVADASADAVFVAQAFHWFDPVPALNEIARVLAAGGMLGLIWNTRDDSEPWVAEFSRILSLPVEAASAWDWSDGRPVSQHPEFRDYRERRVPQSGAVHPPAAAGMGAVDLEHRDPRAGGSGATAGRTGRDVPHPPRPARPRHVPAADGHHDHPRHS